MSVALRDYFAARAATLSLFNIRDMMGWPKDLPEGTGEEEYADTIIARWNALTPEARARLEAEWSYLFADAMLAERAKGDPS
jgi:hypothetical protein